MAEQNDQSTRHITKVIEDMVYEDEYGSVTIRQKDMKRLGIRNGDVMVLKRFPGLSTDHVEWLAKELGENGYPDTIVIVVDALSDVKSLNEVQMNNYGWFRESKSG